jgi:hypothetical protein
MLLPAWTSSAFMWRPENQEAFNLRKSGFYFVYLLRSWYTTRLRGAMLLSCQVPVCGPCGIPAKCLCLPGPLPCSSAIPGESCYHDWGSHNCCLWLSVNGGRNGNAVGLSLKHVWPLMSVASSSVVCLHFYRLCVSTCEYIWISYMHLYTYIL